MPIRRARRARQRRNPDVPCVALTRPSTNAEPFSIHAAGCSDIARERRDYGAKVIGEFPSLAAAKDGVLDDEIRRMGYGMESVRVYPCTRSGPKAAKPLAPDVCPGSGQPFAGPITRETRIGTLRHSNLPCPVCRVPFGTGRGVLPRHKKRKPPEVRVCRYCGATKDRRTDGFGPERMCPKSPQRVEWARTHSWKKP